MKAKLSVLLRSDSLRRREGLTGGACRSRTDLEVIVLLLLPREVKGLPIAGRNADEMLFVSSEFQFN